VKSIKYIFTKEFYIPKLDRLGNIIGSFSLLEKLIFFIFSILFIITSLGMLLNVNAHFLVKVPKFGGTLTEGVVGTPRFINPVIAISDADRDLTSLVYSGLMRTTEDGTLVPDIAEKYEISEDGLEYHFYLKENAVFHDGKPVTADDVIFTILQTQDPAIKSPRRANWDSIAIEKINDKEIIFRLSQPYNPFIFNTTMGILPKHLWGNIVADEFAFSSLNINPVGSGPYKVKDVNRDSAGIIEEYVLQANPDFILGKPFIKNIVVRFYRNEQEIITALRDDKIETINGISPDSAKELQDEGFRIEQLPLPRIFGVFFNQNQAPILANKAVRQALDASVNRKGIIDGILKGFGNEIKSPIPESLIPFEVLESDTEKEELTPTEKGLEILTDAGWEVNEDGFMEKENKGSKDVLRFKISTGNVPELIEIAEYVVSEWRKIGADASLEIFESNDLNNNVIRPRKYDSLFFGEVIGRDLDFYAFWHSSQRNDPGLNIANYANIDVDRYLENVRNTQDDEKNLEYYREFEKEIQKDTPAVFLYTPDFIYILPKNLEGTLPRNISTPSERFMNVYKWYLETDTVWSIFS